MTDKELDMLYELYGEEGTMEPFPNADNETETTKKEADTMPFDFDSYYNKLKPNRTPTSKETYKKEYRYKEEFYSMNLEELKAYDRTDIKNYSKRELIKMARGLILCMIDLKEELENK